MRAVNRDLTFAGVIVVAPSEADESPTSEQKAVLDALHLRKIDLADRVLIVNPGGVRRRVDAERDRLRPGGRQANRLHRSPLTTRRRAHRKLREASSDVETCCIPPRDPWWGYEPACSGQPP